MNGARIRLERLQFDSLDPRSRADLKRQYTVVLDGEDIGAVELGEWIGISTKPGAHELRLAVGMLRSSRLEVELVEGQEITVECWANATPVFWPHWLMRGRAPYVGIARADKDSFRQHRTSDPPVIFEAKPERRAISALVWTGALMRLAGGVLIVRSLFVGMSDTVQLIASGLIFGGSLVAWGAGRRRQSGPPTGENDEEHLRPGVARVDAVRESHQEASKG